MSYGTVHLIKTIQKKRINLSNGFSAPLTFYFVRFLFPEEWAVTIATSPYPITQSINKFIINYCKSIALHIETEMFTKPQSINA